AGPLALKPTPWSAFTSCCKQRPARGAGRGRGRPPHGFGLSSCGKTLRHCAPIASRLRSTSTAFSLIASTRKHTLLRAASTILSTHSSKEVPNSHPKNSLCPRKFMPEHEILKKFCLQDSEFHQAEARPTSSPAGAGVPAVE